MRVFFLSLCFLCSFSLMAHTQVVTQIYDIELGQDDEAALIFLSNGTVVTYPLSDKIQLHILKESIPQKLWFAITYNKNYEIIGIESASAPYYPPVKSKQNFSSQPYVPSILPDMNMAKELFSTARGGARSESECYNRAHVWSYEWRINHNLYSSKAWLFFTRRFIRKHKFHWWFHVAPMVQVIVEGKVKERIMDVKYAKGPIKLKTWTDIFLKDRAHCPVVDKYSDQANYPESGSCFTMKSSMYYYQPIDLERLEMFGDERLRWEEVEVRNSYTDAFAMEI